MLHTIIVLAGLTVRAADDPLTVARQRALNYLTDEVPRWKKDNGCYSCHNNGDAARALMAGGRIEAVTDTLQWLAKPGEWDHQQTDAEFRDKRLARIQFSLALAEAVERGLIRQSEALRSAAESLATIQAHDGSWPLEQEAALGSPATYGTALATYAAIRVLTAARIEEPVARAMVWINGLKSKAALDQAAIILARRSRGLAVEIAPLLEAQGRGGGWGPYRATPPEPFDTAIAILALKGIAAPAAREAVDRGRRWLIQEQLSAGGWAGTTRPAGGAGYAQHISTSGWAALALID